MMRNTFPSDSPGRTSPIKKTEPGVRRDPKRGTWLYVIDAPGRDGKRRQVWKRGFATREEANAAAIKFRTEIADQLVPLPDHDSVAAFARAHATCVSTNSNAASINKIIDYFLYPNFSSC
jgi:hypothetical protein